MRATLEFDLDDPFDLEEHNMALNGSKYKGQIDDIWNMCFRPANKHGYPDKGINDLLEKLGDDGYKLIDKLGELYQDIIRED